VDFADAFKVMKDGGSVYRRIWKLDKYAEVPHSYRCLRLSDPSATYGRLIESVANDGSLGVFGLTHWMVLAEDWEVHTE
jgi:hypothetical protein